MEYFFLIIVKENSWFVESDVQYEQLTTAQQCLFIINELHMPCKLKMAANHPTAKKGRTLERKPAVNALAALFRHHLVCALEKGEFSISSHTLSALSHYILRYRGIYCLVDD